MKKKLNMAILILTISMFAIPAFYYTSLPEEIPIHFNFKGEADSFGAKSTIWAICGIGLILLLLVRFALKNIPKNNATNTSKFLPQIIYIFLLVIFNYLTFATILVSLSHWDDLGTWFLFSIIIIFNLLGIISYYRQISSERKN